MSGMTYGEKIDALYTRQKEYVQGEVDNGKLVVSDTPLRTNELEVGSYSTAPRTGDGVIPYYIPSTYFIGMDVIDHSDGSCLNVMGSTHRYIYLWVKRKLKTI